MNNKLRAIAPLVAVSALLAVSAGAETVVGAWDFSQYRGSGSLAPVGATTLSANYSDLDPTHKAGAESAAYGTATLPNLTDVLPTAGTMNCFKDGSGPGHPHGCSEPRSRGPVSSNHEVGDISFDQFGVLRHEGQTYTNRFAMTATSNASVVFEADLTPASTVGSGWSISFGGRTANGGGPDGGELSCDTASGPPDCTSTVGVDFSSDGVSYSPVGSVMLDNTDTAYTVSGGGANLSTGYFRLNFDTAAGTPIIDNVAVGVQVLPEPGEVAGMMAGVGLLGLLARRRRA